MKKTKKGKIEKGGKGPLLRSSRTGTPPHSPTIKTAALDTHERARRELARLIAARSQGKIDPGVFSQLVWSMQVLLPALRAEKWADVEKRLEKLEQMRG